ncbi:MAG: NrdH-redoxin [Candidatus Magasanikbacteria bacterium]|nr:NrdH-redoxin [Candidatus Magasanikbacteria bacterium]
MKKIIIYSTPACPYCKMAKAYFQKQNIAYTDYDVSAEADKAKEMVKKSGQMGVPVIDVGGKIIIGFEQKQIEEALKA